MSAGEAFPTLHDGGLGVVDVGARGGIAPVFLDAAPLLHVVGCEPDPAACRPLAAALGRPHPFRSLTVLPYALGASDGERPLTVCRSGGSSSFYAPNRRFLDRFPEASRFDCVGTTVVAVRTLDRVIHGEGRRLLPAVDFLKVDAQGAELEILQGAQQVLREEVLGVEVEVEFTPQYTDQPLFRDVDAYLAARGFTLFKLRRLEWVRRGFTQTPHLTAGQLVLGDALYLKDPLNQAGPPPAAATARQTEALILLATLYDLHDFALELCTASAVPRPGDAEAARRYVLQRAHGLAGPFHTLRGLARGAKAYWQSRGDLRHLLPWLRRYGRSWARADQDFYSRLTSDGVRAG